MPCPAGFLLQRGEPARVGRSELTPPATPIKKWVPGSMKGWGLSGGETASPVDARSHRTPSPAECWPGWRSQRPCAVADATQGASTVAHADSNAGTLTGAASSGLKTRSRQWSRRADFEVPTCIQPAEVGQLRECTTDSSPDQRDSKVLAWLETKKRVAKPPFFMLKVPKNDQACFCLRREAAARPARPKPSRASEPGSGTETDST